MILNSFTRQAFFPEAFEILIILVSSLRLIGFSICLILVCIQVNSQDSASVAHLLLLSARMLLSDGRSSGSTPIARQQQFRMHPQQQKADKIISTSKIVLQGSGTPGKRELPPPDPLLPKPPPCPPTPRPSTCHATRQRRSRLIQDLAISLTQISWPLARRLQNIKKN